MAGDRGPAAGGGRFQTPTGPACAAARAGPRGVGDTRAVVRAAPYGSKRNAPQEDLRVGWPDGWSADWRMPAMCGWASRGEEHGRSGGAAAVQVSTQFKRLNRVAGRPAATRAAPRPPWAAHRPSGGHIRAALNFEGGRPDGGAAATVAARPKLVAARWAARFGGVAATFFENGRPNLVRGPPHLAAWRPWWRQGGPLTR